MTVQLIRAFLRKLPIGVTDSISRGLCHNKLTSRFKVSPDVIELFPDQHIDELARLAKDLENSGNSTQKALEILERRIQDLTTKSSGASISPSEALRGQVLYKPSTKQKTPSLLFEGTKNKEVSIQIGDYFRKQGHIVNYRNHKKADVLRNKISFIDDLGLSFQKQKGFVQPKSTDSWTSITKQAQEYSNNFAKNSRTGFTKLPNGTRYVGGGGSHFDVNGLPNRFRAAQEGILIDFENDKILKRVLDNFTQKVQKADFNEEQKLELIMQYVDDVFTGAGNPESLVRNFDQYKIYKLGDIIDSGAGVCRHRSLLTKLLADREGVKVSCVTGCYKGGGHMWTEALMTDERKLLADPMHRAIIDVTTPERMYSKALNYAIEVNSKTGKLVQCYK